MPPGTAGGLDYDVGSTLIFTCDSGYIIEGSNYDIRCIVQHNKPVWSKRFPTCIRK